MVLTQVTGNINNYKESYMKRDEKSFLMPLIIILIFTSKSFCSDNFDRIYNNAIKRGEKVERLDNDRMKIGGLLLSRKKPMTISLPNIQIKNIIEFKQVNYVTSGWFLSNDEFVYLSDDYAKKTIGLIEITDKNIIHLISPDGYDAKTSNKKRYRLFGNSHATIETLEENGKVIDEMLVYDLDNRMPVNTTKQVGQKVIYGEVRTIQSKNIEKLNEDYNSSVITAGNTKLITQGKYDFILYDGMKQTITKFNAVSEEIVNYDQMESSKIIMELLNNNVGGETKWLHSITWKPTGSKFDDGFQGLYEWDEKGKETKLFDYGKLTYWCPDEKARIVIVDVDGKNAPESMVLFVGRGENIMRIPFIGYRIHILALSLDHKTLAIREEDNRNIAFIEFANSLY
jgi:hypothetical protein